MRALLLLAAFAAWSPAQAQPRDNLTPRERAELREVIRQGERDAERQRRIMICEAEARRQRDYWPNFHACMARFGPLP